ncbi:MAG TPA: type II toxin-antitoxin system RelE/ParE family toxin [Desulfuromonadaceae bacterium]
MKSEFLPEAEKELREAARYYESEAPGVGIAFIVEVHKTVATILDNPLAAQTVRKSIRKKVLSRFPFNVLYSVEAETIVVVAVAHQKRRPTYWRRRQKKQKP